MRSNGDEQWPGLADLTHRTKAEQRRILRLHREAGFDLATDNETIALRDRVDRELQIIMLRELRTQSDPVRVQEQYAEEIKPFAILLRDSPAFVQYLNYYYYFGVRFAAGRISNPCVPNTPSDRPSPSAGADCNEPIVGLPSPPFCPDLPDTSPDIVRFVAETAAMEMLDPEIGAALRFLDDFVDFGEGAKTESPEQTAEAGERAETERSGQTAETGDGDERIDFELWLRGLYNGEKAKDRFPELAAGFLKWAENRCRFYLSLEQLESKKDWLLKWQSSAWKEGRFNVNNPISARCALVDFYWLARILRADVTPRGMISYRGRSWLQLMAMKGSPVQTKPAIQTEPPSRTEPPIRTEPSAVEKILGRVSKPPAPPRDEKQVREILREAREQPVTDKMVEGLIDALYPGDTQGSTGSSRDHESRRLKKEDVRQHWEKILNLITASPHSGPDEPAIHALCGNPPVAGAEARIKFWSATLQAPEILRMEEVLRAVFAYACDLIENAVEVAEECEGRRANPADFPDRPASTRSWRAVYDRELREIAAQRREWRAGDGTSNAEIRSATCEESSENAGWSRRIWTGEDVDNLVGVAFSGGGIRSATFNLGVLQRLQELDLLRRIDYISTVSGGGYIGAWMLGNVRRTRYWLSRLTSWDKSIEHLRRYSSYLSPENGLLHADSWTMWGTWIRNAFLIQLTGFSWLAFFLVFTLAVKNIFVWSGSDAGRPFAKPTLFGLLTAIALIIVFYLWQLSKPYVPPGSDSIDRLRAWVVNKGNLFPVLAAALAWVASFVTAALLWEQAINRFTWTQQYSSLLLHAWSDWPPLLIAGFIGALWLLAVTGFRPKSGQGPVKRLFWSVVIALATVATAYLALCGLLRLYGVFMTPGMCADPQRAGWYAMVFGPNVAMAGVSLAIAIFIGLLGRDSDDWSREWWTRYGAWIAMLGTAALTFALAAVFAPLWVYKLARLSHSSIKVTTVAGWVGSVVGGLFAGKSSRTGQDGKTSISLEWIARIGGLTFLIGALAGVSTVVHIVLAEIILPDFNWDHYWQNLTAIAEPRWPDYWQFWVILVALLLISFLFSYRFDLNTFGLNQFYRNRLVRCYLGATRWQPGKRHPHRFTAFDTNDDIDLASLTVKNSQFCGESFRGPLPIINCTLNLGGSSDLTVHTRQSAPFTLTPLFCGSERRKVGYISTGDYAPLTLGQAISVSGAAASPNSGYNTSPLVAFLMTMFNVRLGWWFRNPGTGSSNNTGALKPFYLVLELFGLAGEQSGYVNISDGGHFENLGIYELVRRRTRVIVAADAECDPDMTFGSLGNVIRICETDFGARIDIDVASLRTKDAKDQKRPSHAHCAVGKITYCNGSMGYLIYIKSSLTGDEDVGVSQYQAGHPTFPHETTADQFFSEDQFEAYRRLGDHITERTFRGAENEPPEFYAIASKLFDLWVPAAFSNDAFLTNSRAFDQILDRYRTDQNLRDLCWELSGEMLPPPPGFRPLLNPVELIACMELLQLMENVFLELRLEDFWEHPDNRGWAMTFIRWAQSEKFRQAWAHTRQTYGIRFEYFCNQHLGLRRDLPVMRL